MTDREKLKERIETRLEEKVKLEEIEEGSDTLYRVKTGDKNLIAKAHTYEGLEREKFIREEKVIEKVSNETDLPVPEVISTNFETEGLDFFLMTELDGKNFEEIEDSLSSEEKKSFVFDAGKKLAKLHEKIGFESFGQLDKDLRPEGKDWREKFREDMDWRIEKLDETEFSDLRPRIREVLEENISVLDGFDNPVLVHDDVRPANFLIENGEVSGFVDWAQAFAGDPALDFVSGQFRFFGGHNRREYMEEFQQGYETVRGLEISDEKRKIYRLFIITGMMIGFSTFWKKFHSEERQREIARGLRKDLQEVLS